MKMYKFDLPIYYGTIIISKGKNLKKVAKEYNLKIDENIEAFTYRIEQHNYVIGVKKNVELYNIIHEVVHLVNFIYEDHNIKLSKSNDEHQAYLTGYLFNEIYKRL